MGMIEIEDPSRELPYLYRKLKKFELYRDNLVIVTK
jgi:hypothetical protein